jgi:hypothetical protein
MIKTFMGQKQSSFGGKTSVYKVEGATEPMKTRDGYYKNGKGIFYEGTMVPIPKKDLASFKKLKYGYAKTDLSVYYKGNPIPGANPKSFITINRKNMPDEYKKLNSVVGVDFDNGKKRIYQFGVKLLEF